MKDRLGKAKWWNQPLSNPTQNAFRRFQREPGGEWFGKRFNESEREFKTILNKALKTHYSDILDDL